MRETGSFLVESGLASAEGEATKIFENRIPSLSHVQAPYSEFISKYWELFNQPLQLSNNLRGTIFEFLIGVVFLHADVQPFFKQAEVTYVNNARFDFLLWEVGKLPISISVKTSLRERYKQAELEANALKSVHRGALNYLVSLSHPEVFRRRRMLAENNEYSNLDQMILADTVEFDELVAFLAGKSYASPIDVNPMSNKYQVSI